MPDIVETPFTEALLDWIEGYRPEIMDCGAVDIEDLEEYANGYPQSDEDDVLPF